MEASELGAWGAAGDGAEPPWKDLVEGSPVAVAVIADDGTFVYANPQACALYGVAGAAQVVGRASADWIPDDDGGDSEATFVAVLRGAVVRGRRWTLRRHDGRTLPVEINAVRTDYGGRPAVQAELRDVTAQVEAETALLASERRWRELFAASPTGIAVSDHTAHIVAANPALCALLGRSEAEIVGRASADFFHAEDRSTPEHNAALLDRSPDGVVRTERRFYRADGELRWASVSIARIDGDGGARWTLAHMQDITERKAIEQGLAESEADLRAVAEVIKQIQSGGDARQTIVDAARSLARADKVSLLEPSADGLVISASTDGRLVGVTAPLSARSAAVEAYTTGRAVFLADAPSHTSPEVVALSQSSSVYSLPIRDAEGIIGTLAVGWASAIVNVSGPRARVVRVLADQAGVALRQAALVAEMAGMALADPLTGLPNRRHWDQRLRQLLSLTDRSQVPLAIALVDLDHFKAYNDTHGHPAGDEFLRRFATAAQASVRAADTIARWGGEEFAVALPACPPGEARQALERLAAAVPEGQTCSVGYAEWDGHETAAELTARADTALYGAKAGGRNQIRLAERRPA